MSANGSGRRAHAGPGPASGLLLDHYELTMAQSYLDEGLADLPATFSLFCRRLPHGWGYLVAAGLDDVLADLAALRFTDGDLAYLEETRLFGPNLLERLRRLRFSGTVRALPEGTLFFAEEPVLEVTGPMLEAQLVEALVLNRIHFQSLVASKASRCVDAAAGRTLVDFSLRRTPGPEAGLRVARSAYLAGFDSTSNVLAGRVYGIPTVGTMAHSYVQAFPDEVAAFGAFARAYPDSAILLVDTYDTIEGTRCAIVAGRDLAERGVRLRGVRLDSGDLLTLSIRVRELLDRGGFEDAIVFASGGIDEYEIDALLSGGAPIDGFGVGSKMSSSADAPFLDMAYKLVEFRGEPTLKLSDSKATLPGRKEVWRVPEDGAYALDVLDLAGESGPAGGQPLLRDVMVDGRRHRVEPLQAIRARLSTQRELLPPRNRMLPPAPYVVKQGRRLRAVRDEAARAAGEHLLRA